MHVRLCNTVGYETSSPLIKFRYHIILVVSFYHINQPRTERNIWSPKLAERKPGKNKEFQA